MYGAKTCTVWYLCRLCMGPRLVPYGICVDALSHILVFDGSDENNKTVHVLTEDGQFLKYFLTKQTPGIDKLYSLRNDLQTHLLYVGSRRNVHGTYKQRSLSGRNTSLIICSFSRINYLIL